MSATSVGQIGLDLVVNQNQFKKQMTGIQSLASKTGKALAGAFAVTKIIQFGKQCIELGSDLEEVQNVVDVTFPNMTAKVNEFAQSAASAFGLSETMAKQYTGTFGAMAKSFGFSEQAAYEMSTTLTGLAGDVASFYNLSQDEAYTKLKSVFTGETESLKELGVVMTQTALDQYALANGFGKTTSAMSEAEKVALRYAFVQDQLSAASGDFIRTSNSWANQVKILKLQMESFMSTVGQGLINIFTPVIKVINLVIQKLLTLANAFKAFTELITGKSGSDAVASAGSSASESLDSATESANNLASSTSAAGNAAEETARKMRQLMGFDAINKLSDESSSSGSGGSGGGVSGDSFDFGELDDSETILEEVNEQFQGIIDRFKELQELFAEGFKLGLGDTSVFQSIEDSLSSIKQSFQEIFTSDELINAANEWMDSLAHTLGTAAGSLVSVGASIADMLLGGIAEYLEENSQRITDFLIGMFEVGTEIDQKIDEVCIAISEIFEVFRSDEAKGITADIIQIFSDGFMAVIEYTAKFAEDLLDLITSPFVDNKDSIITAIENILDPLEEVFDSLADAWRYLWDDVGQLYDDHVAPLFDSITDGFSKIVGTLVDGFNEHIAPVLDKLANKFSEVMESNLKPAIDKLMDALGSIFDLLKTLWEKILEPLFLWIADNIMPILEPIIDAIGTALFDAVADICDGFGLFFDKVKEVADGLKEFIDKASDAINKVKEFPENVKMTISAVKDAAWDKITAAWEAVKDSKVVKTVSGKIAEAFTNAKEKWDKLKKTTVVKTLSSKLTSNFTKFKKTWDSLKDKTLKIKADVSAAITNIKKLINDKIIAKLNGAINILNKLPGVNVPKIPKLAQGGFVKRNTPQLAVVGDNMRYGEIVAPENKLEAMAKQAAAMAGGGNNAEIVALLRQILLLLQTLDLVATVEGNSIKQLVVRLINDHTKATGMCEINI